MTTKTIITVSELERINYRTDDTISFVSSGLIDPKSIENELDNTIYSTNDGNIWLKPAGLESSPFNLTQSTLSEEQLSNINDIPNIKKQTYKIKFQGQVISAEIEIKPNEMTKIDTSIGENVNLPGSPTTTTPAKDDNSAKIATTQYVKTTSIGIEQIPTQKLDAGATLDKLINDHNQVPTTGAIRSILDKIVSDETKEINDLKSKAVFQVVRSGTSDTFTVTPNFGIYWFGTYRWLVTWIDLNPRQADWSGSWYPGTFKLDILSNSAIKGYTSTGALKVTLDRDLVTSFGVYVRKGEPAATGSANPTWLPIEVPSEAQIFQYANILSSKYPGTTLDGRASDRFIYANARYTNFYPDSPTIRVYFGFNAKEDALNISDETLEYKSEIKFKVTYMD